MSEPLRTDELVERLLVISTLNSTLIHFLLSSEIEGRIDPDRVDSLTQGLQRTRKWMENATTANGISDSEANIMGLIIKRLSQIENLLPRLAEREKLAKIRGRPATEILSLLEGETTRVPGEVEQVPTQATPAPDTAQVPQEFEPPQEDPYRKVDIEDDEWGLIGTTQRMINQYAKRCHILLPMFWLEVLKELHRYRSNSPYIGDVIEMPAKVVVRIIRGLLTEAPGARLLQDLQKKRPPERELMPDELERIERAVAKYFAGVEPVLAEEDVNVQEKVLEAQTTFDSFDWGGPELEKRIIKRLNQRCEETLRNAETDSDATRQVIYAETSKLLCKLQLAILAEPRFREVLAQMKP
ncbi:MAG: hypothetical protein GF309_10125 [Candidatus Lokiarchaeota archaeon]|nr:hypothetical protein [Candidatus Lokiarchaeota archaeon]